MVVDELKFRIALQVPGECLGPLAIYTKGDWVLLHSGRENEIIVGKILAIGEVQVCIEASDDSWNNFPRGNMIANLTHFYRKVWQA